LLKQQLEAYKKKFGELTLSEKQRKDGKSHAEKATKSKAKAERIAREDSHVTKKS